MGFMDADNRIRFGARLGVMDFSPRAELHILVRGRATFDANKDQHNRQ